MLDTVAIQNAINAAAGAGGGRVVLPSGGKFLSSTINLRGKVTLHLEKGATLLGSTDLAHYRRLNFLALVMANEQREIGTTGEGTIDGCKDVVVRGCDIESQDDALCLKSPRRAGENILIENCRLRSSCNALKFGTASFVGFKNITVRNLEIYATYLSGITLQSVDGGLIENVSISKVRMKTTNNPIFIRLGHRNDKAPPGAIRNVTISDVTAEIPNRPRGEMNKFPPYWRHQCTTLITGSISGIPGHPVRDVTLRNIRITYGGIGDSAKPDHILLENLIEVPHHVGNYPESKMFGVLPAWGFYVRYADGLRFENMTLDVSCKDYRAGAVFASVRNLKLDRLRILSAGKEPPLVPAKCAGRANHPQPGPRWTCRMDIQKGKNQRCGGEVTQQSEGLRRTRAKSSIHPPTPNARWNSPCP